MADVRPKSLVGYSRVGRVAAMYNRVFTKILDSSIWLESTATRIVWLTFIAMMDEDGFVALAMPSNVALRARVSKSDAEKAIKILQSEEKDSLDDDHKGKRIERVPGGWIVLNAGKYREMATRKTIRDSNRARVQRHRSKHSG